MRYLETPYEQRSFAISTAIIVILLLLFFVFGLTYLDPPPENGIAVNFGNTEFGSGDNRTMETVQSAPQPSSSAKASSAPEEISTQDIEEAPVIKESKKPSKSEESTPTPTPAPKPQKPSKSTETALSNLLNGPKSEGSAREGEGNDDLPGNKGKAGGDPYANSYYGSGGSGGGGNGWGLNGRVLKNTGKEVQQCNQSGRVVVQITVNRNGNVVAANYTKGTTNTDPCLVEPALATARKYKWQADPDAPEKQIGFIIVNFSLGE